MPTSKTRIIGGLVVAAVLAGGGAVALKKFRARWRALDASSATLAPQANRSGKPLEAADAAEVIYDGQLGAGWSDWGWGPHELPAHGAAKVVFAGYGGIILQHEALQKKVGAVSFRFKAPKEWGNFLLVSLKLAGAQDSLFRSVPIETRHLLPLPDGFYEALVPWRDLDPSGAPFDRLVISAPKLVGNDQVVLDKIFLLPPSAAAADSAQAPTRPVELEIRCDQQGHPISPLIYGSAGGDFDSHQTGERLGGNPTTRLNWDGPWWNSANDWFFENGKGLDVSTWVRTAAEHGVRVAVTVPMIGWVAKDDSSVGFPSSKFPKQRKFDQYRPQAGDGYLDDKTPIHPGSPTQTSVEAPPQTIGRWVRALREQDRARDKRVIDEYILDNEPTLWDTTHRDVHPDPLTYDELLDRTIRYASEVRAADPEAKIAGPAEWGWMGYFYSAKDRNDGKFIRSDRRAHGDEPLLAWYLKKLAQYEKDHGTRLLDVLDVHFYPAADKIYGGDARTDDEGAALRVRATRALWDPTYVDESWINEPVRLIPRLKEWVAGNYPGLGISLGEWSFGADNHISGAIATAEALGRFGQQGLYSAFYWQGPKANSGTFWAFRAFTNFDGAGARFLDESVPVRETEKVSLFASRDDKGNVVAVIVNRDQVFAGDAHVTLRGCGSLESQREFQYADGATSLAARPLVAGARADKVVTAVPPFSITVLDLHLKR